LGEFLLAKYFPKEKFYFLLPRMTHDDITRLDNSDKKEWKVIRADDQGKVITLEDLEGIPERIERGILELKNTPLGGPTSSVAKVKWNKLINELRDLIKDGVVKIK